MPPLNIDAKIVIVGTTRIGKSMQQIQFARRITSAKNMINLGAADKILIKSNYSTENIIYSQKQSIDHYKKFTNSVLSFDETYLTMDRREAMAQGNINVTRYLDIFASQLNITFALAQDLTDLDQRVINKATALILDYERGGGLLFAKGRSFPIIKQTFDFDRLQKYPRMLRDKKIGIHNLKKVMGYIGKITWDDEPHNLLYMTHVEYKKMWQQKL